MKVLFLDIDGVLNSNRFLRENPIDDKQSVFDRDVNQIDSGAVGLLNEIIEQTDAQVVISSTWRLLMPVGQIQRVLRARGFKGVLFDKTPRIPGIRGHEISHWLRFTAMRASIESFVILDDDSDMGLLMPHLVQTNVEIGLMPCHVVEAIEKLNK